MPHPSGCKKILTELHVINVPVTDSEFSDPENDHFQYFPEVDIEAF